MEEDTGKSLHVGGATGRIHGADYSLVDYNRAGIPLIEIVTKPIDGAGARAPEVARAYVARAARPAARARRLRRADGAGLAALRRQRVAAAVAGRAVRHPHRDQERQLAAHRRAGGALRDHAPGRASSPPAARVVQETRHWHEDTGVTTSGPREVGRRGLPLLPRARPRADRARPRRGSSALRGTLPEPPAQRRAPAAGATGASATSRCATSSNAGAVELIEATVAAGAPPAAARKWWSGELARRANADGVELDATCRSRRRRSPSSQALVDARHGSTTSWPGRCSTACSPARATRRRSSPPAGSRSSRDDGALGAAVDRAIAANPDVADKIRDGKVAGGRRADRRGDEGDARPGRRRPRPRARPGEARGRVAPRHRSGRDVAAAASVPRGGPQQDGNRAWTSRAAPGRAGRRSERGAGGGRRASRAAVPPVRAANLALGFSLAVVAAGVVASLGIAGADSAVPAGRHPLGRHRAGQRGDPLAAGVRGAAPRAVPPDARAVAGGVGGRASSTTAFAVALGPLSFPSPGDLISLCAAPIRASASWPCRARRRARTRACGSGSTPPCSASRSRCWAGTWCSRTHILPAPFTARRRLGARRHRSPTSPSSASASSRSSGTSTATCCWSRRAVLLRGRRPDDAALLARGPGQLAVAGAVLWCLAWPLIAAGLLRYQPRALIPVDRESAVVDPDARGVTITTTVSLLAAADLAGAARRVAAAGPGVDRRSSSPPSSCSGRGSC